MNMKELFENVAIHCPICQSGMKLFVDSDDKTIQREHGLIEMRTTVTPYMKCEKCKAEYIPEINLHRRFRNIKIECKVVAFSSADDKNG